MDCLCTDICEDPKIDDRTHYKLKKMEGDGSFSKFLSLPADESKVGSKESLRRFYGTLTEEEEEPVETAIKELRISFRGTGYESSS